MKLKDKELVGLAEAYNKVLENIFEPKEAAIDNAAGEASEHDERQEVHQGSGIDSLVGGDWGEELQEVKTAVQAVIDSGFVSSESLSKIVQEAESCGYDDEPLPTLNLVIGDITVPVEGTLKMVIQKFYERGYSNH